MIILIHIISSNASVVLNFKMNSRKYRVGEIVRSSGKIVVNGYRYIILYLKTVVHKKKFDLAPCNIHNYLITLLINFLDVSVVFPYAFIKNFTTRMYLTVRSLIKKIGI